MMNGVWNPKKRRTMFGSDTVVAPLETPLYESASARAPVPACSFTTETIGDPKLLTTPENCASPGRSVALFGTPVEVVPGPRTERVRRVTQGPSRIVEAEPCR